MLPNIVIISTIFSLLIHETLQKYEWKECSDKPAKCDRYDKPPLVVISLDGFHNGYLKKKIVKTLDYLADCGAKAKHVYPSYPSKTLPNHYTMVTGLYPESHGIVDNKVYDPDLKKFADVKKTTEAKYYGGEPIWSMYKKHFPSKKVLAYYWTGSEMNLFPQYPIDEAKRFDTSVPLEARLQEIVDNLEKEKDKVPELILAYHNQPDATGHFHIKNETAMNEALQKLDDQLEAFVNKLHQKGILDCINLVIVSDHGMQPININVDISQHLGPEASKHVVIMNNIIGTVHNISSHSVDQFHDSLACKIPNVKVYNKKTIPTRKHYSSHKSIGDLILEGDPGVTFGDSPEKREGDHGYDFVVENMYAIFVGRGPSFNKGVVVEPFQNVQYMNLWIDLLGIPEEEKQKNNGTIGFLNTVLKNPRKVELDKTPRIAECERKDHQPQPTECVENKPKALVFEDCKNTGARLPFSTSSRLVCYQRYCLDNVIKHKTVPLFLTISEGLSSSDSVSNATIYEADYSMNQDRQKCAKLTSKHYSISVRKNLVDSFVDVEESFNEKVLKPLDVLTKQYLNDFQTIHVITGTTFDPNYDGLLNKNIPANSRATHLYRIIIICPGGWRTVSPPKCMKPKRMETLSFIFPIATPKAWDCITSDQLLKDYTATIVDVERISGFRFQIEQASPQINANIRQRITDKFWKIEDYKEEEDDEENVSGAKNVVWIMLCFVLYFY